MSGNTEYPGLTPRLIKHLFDLQEDPHELTNIAHEHPQIETQLAEILLAEQTRQ